MWKINGCGCRSCMKTTNGKSVPKGRKRASDHFDKKADAIARAKETPKTKNPW